MDEATDVEALRAERDALREQLAERTAVVEKVVGLLEDLAIDMAALRAEDYAARLDQA